MKWFGHFWHQSKGHLKPNLPAFLWVLITFVVEVQRNLCIQSNSKVIIHDTLLCVTFTAKQKNKTSTPKSWYHLLLISQRIIYIGEDHQAQLRQMCHCMCNSIN